MKKKNNNHMDSRTNTILTSLFECLARRKATSGNSRTAKNYLSCTRKLRTYLGGQADSFSLQQVTSCWVEDWVEWLSQVHPHHPGTVDFYFRCSRAMYNQVAASHRGRQKGDYPPHPFKGIRIRKDSTARRALPAGEVKRLLGAGFRATLHVRLHESLDVLLFMLFMRGMVFQDVYNLRWDAIDAHGRIRYRRSKTGSLIETGIPPEAVEIMERYRCHHSPYVFPFLHRGKKAGSEEITEDTALRRVNCHAAAIGTQAELSIPLSTYVMRHTWATLMLESGKPVELISQCLGHASIRTTQIYLSRISTAKADTEVNDMFDQLLRQAPPETGKNKQEKTSRRNTPEPPREGEKKEKENPGESRKKEPQQHKHKEKPPGRGKKKIPEEEKSPFLSKKRRKPPQDYDRGFLPGTKIGFKTIWTKFTSNFLFITFHLLSHFLLINILNSLIHQLVIICNTGFCTNNFQLLRFLLRNGYYNKQ